jgi:hypothetical protein
MASEADPTEKAVNPKRLQEETEQRLADARYQKVQFDLDLREGYWFAAPHRARNVLSTTKTTRVKPKDAQELNTSFAFELCGDFATVMMNTFMPEVEKWAIRRPSMIVPDAARQQIAQTAAEGDDVIFQAISESNFYSECAKGFNPDLALGTVGLWIESRKGYEPIKCTSIPIRELELNVGADGCVDDRFVVQYRQNRHIRQILPGVSLPAKIQRDIARKPGGDCVIMRGFWCLYEDDGDERWQYVATVNGAVVDQKQIKGVGSCPLVVGRFNPCVEWAWGVGSLIQALPDLRVLDELAMKKIKTIDMLLMPPISYPDDSFSHLDAGIEAGMAYPMRPGSEGAIKSIYNPPPPDPAIFFTQDLEQRVKRLFFLDWPTQDGKTPPTATQWLDEMTLAQRRIGTPGMSFWKEFCGGAFQRFEYLLTKLGALPSLATKDGKAVSTTPYNPAIKSAEQQEVAQFTRFVQIAGAAAPEEFKVYTDGEKTIDNLAQKLAVTKIWEKRPKEQVAAAIDQISKLAGGQAPTAPAVPQGAPQAENPAGPAPNQPMYDIRSTKGSV